MNWVPFWPEAASTSAVTVDDIFIGELALTLFICFVVYFLILLNCFRFRRGSSAERGDRAKKSWHWEITWTSATLIGFLILFVWGAGAYLWMYQPPATGEEIHVVGKQWMWKIQHPGGQREINELHVPVGQVVRLVMTSQDVIHSFYVPAFRLKHDVVPGQYETMWFKATVPGRYRIECTQYCGTDHAAMIGWVYAMTPQDYERWLTAQVPEENIAQAGEQLFHQLGCSGCHGVNATIHAPSLKGLFGKPVHLQNGKVVIADESYLHDCILLGAGRIIVAGYPPVMPSFAGQISEADVFKLVAYIKSLATSTRPAR